MPRYGFALPAMIAATAIISAAAEPPGVVPPAAWRAPPAVWSTLVSPRTLETEIRAQPAPLDAAITSTNPQKNTRMTMTYLAVLFGVVDLYEQPTPWKNDAHAQRDHFTQAARPVNRQRER